MESFVQRVGYPGIALIVAAESMGIPLPAETVLISAALYAAATDRLDIAWVVAAAIIGAIAGDNAGYWLGRRFGLPALARFGPRIGLTSGRLALGRYLFYRHGGAVVFFGRFTALLRTFAALLAGANSMGWTAFLAWNAMGGIVWASAVGFGAYALGAQITRLAAPVGIAAGLAAGTAACGLAWALHRRGAEMEAHAVAVMAARDRDAARPALPRAGR